MTRYWTLDIGPVDPSGETPIFHVDDDGVTHKALLAHSLIRSGRHLGNCVWYDGDWMSASRAAREVVHQSEPGGVNGWWVWLYERSDGRWGWINEIRYSLTK